MRERMNCNQYNHAKRASMAYQILGFTDDGNVIIDMLKNNKSNNTGRMVVPASLLIGQIYIK